ncbi:MAG: gliding motility-associated ABC transporter substrate-binding protein GldG [Saprospiraceae bacterium]|nr:gliding motility-associated ABC transporter substrate-binding protein GldG [Saprospiraceae bacterium]
MKNKSGYYLQALLYIGIIFMVNVIANFFHFSVDLTGDKRYTLSNSTKKIISQPDDNIFIKVYLDGEFPSGFKRLRSSTLEFLENIRDVNDNIVYEFEDPTGGSEQQLKKRKEEFEADKISPILLNFYDGSQMVQKPIFPFAVIYYKNKKFVVNLLEEQLAGDNEELVLNRSVELLEYKFASAFQRITAQRPKRVLFTTGNAELERNQLIRLESEIRKNHLVGWVHLDSIMKIDTTIDLMVVAGPRNAISLKNLFKIDQYIMVGGKVIWLLDKMEASLDSINVYGMYIPPDINTGTDEILFKYGVRIMPDLIMDIECSSIPQVVGMQGGKPQTQLFPWYYHLSIAPLSTHPIVKNIDRVNMFFPSSIDTLKTDDPVKKTILLQSSEYSRTQLSPARLSFEILKTAPDPEKFNDGKKNVAVLLEGGFSSAFENRLTPELEILLQSIGIKFIPKGDPKAKQMVVSDADFAKNLVNTTSGETEQIGYNKWERAYYKGNKDFISNAIEYMLDGDNIIESRSKEVKLRLLDPVRIKEDKTKWQMINVVLPVVILGLFGGLYSFWRRRKYAGTDTP